MFHTLYVCLDTFLISFYRLTDAPIVGFMAGTFVLAWLANILGRLFYTVASRANRQSVDRENREMVRMHNLSFRALLAKDKDAYKACNKQANDAFGKYFFASAAVGMSSLWPAAFALAWMDTRFAGVDFLLPIAGRSVGYAATFIPMYALAHIVNGKFVRYLPWLAASGKAGTTDDGRERMLSMEDLMAPPAATTTDGR